MVAIRIRGLSRYIGPQLEMDGLSRPQEALRTLLRIAGISLPQSDDQGQSTVAAPGYVLRDLTLDIEQGSVVCVMSASGPDASVLLQVLGGAVPPTAGTIEIHGCVTRLLSKSEGLDTSLTAHENIRASMQAGKADPEQAGSYATEVIDFAELHGFEHVPLRAYSTGMILRLGVALALCGRVSVVLIDDDVLGVGDISFQQKCVERMLALRAAGCTMVLASNDESLVQQLATRVITLAGGRIVHDSAAHEIAARVDDAEISWHVHETLPESDVVALRSIAVDAVRDGDETYLDVVLEVAPKADGLRCRPMLSLVNQGSVLLYRSLFPEFVPAPRPNSLVFTARVPTHMLPAGRYALGVGLTTLQRGKAIAAKGHEAVLVTIRRPETEAAQGDAAPLLHPRLTWDTAMLMQASITN